MTNARRRVLRDRKETQRTRQLSRLTERRGKLQCLNELTRCAIYECKCCQKLKRVKDTGGDGWEIENYLCACGGFMTFYGWSFNLK